METHPTMCATPEAEPDREWDVDDPEAGNRLLVEMWFEPFAVKITANGRPVTDHRLACSAMACVLLDQQDRITNLEETVELLSQEPS